MPIAAIGMGLGTALAGAAAGGATIYASKAAGGAAKRASAIQSRSDDQALQFAREQDADARKQWEADQAFKKAQFDAAEEERLYRRRRLDEREARAQPYRDASLAALARMPALMGPQGQGGWRSPSQMGRVPAGTLGELARNGGQ